MVRTAELGDSPATREGLPVTYPDGGYVETLAAMDGARNGWEFTRFTMGVS